MTASASTEFALSSVRHESAPIAETDEDEDGAGAALGSGGRSCSVCDGEDDGRAGGKGGASGASALPEEIAQPTSKATLIVRNAKNTDRLTYRR